MRQSWIGLALLAAIACGGARAATPQSNPSLPLAEDPAAELARLQEQQRRAWESINSHNPFKGEAPKIEEGVVGSSGPVEQLNRLLSLPAVQAYLRFFAHPLFSQGLDQVIHSPNRMQLLYAELGLMVLMMIFRAWRYSKSSGWLGRLWTRFWTAVLFWGLAIVAVPWIVLGDPYYRLLAGALDVLMSFIKK